MNVSTTPPRWTYLSECDSPPDGWSVVPFTRIATVIAGQSPPSESYNRKQEGLPFLQGNGDFYSRNPIPTVWCTSPKKTASRGDTLISVRAPVGELNRADKKYAIGRGLAAIRAKDCDGDFLYHALQRWRFSLQRVGQGTTFDAVTTRHFASLLVARPNEQAEHSPPSPVFSTPWTRRWNALMSPLTPRGRCDARCYNRRLNSGDGKGLGKTPIAAVFHAVGMRSTAAGHLSS